MKFNCPSCDAPFDSHGRDFDEVKCPNCGCKFNPNTTKPIEADSLASNRNEHKASRTIWKLLRTNLQNIDDFGNRILFTLPRSPMTAYAWEAAGSPGSLEELRAALSADDKSVKSALSFLYDYLAHYRETTLILYQNVEDEQHLIDLTNLLLECAGGADEQILKEYERILLKLADQIADGTHFVGLMEYFLPETLSDETYEKYLSEFLKSPGKTVELVASFRDEATL